MSNEACMERVKITKVKVEEQGKQAIFLNPKKLQFTRIRVDGCMVNNKTACDWFVVRQDSDGVLVELKGCDVPHALEQIEQTFTILKKNKLIKNRMAALIVCRNPPRHPSFTSKLQRAKDRINIQFKAPLHIVTGNYEFDMDRIMSFKGPF